MYGGIVTQCGEVTSLFIHRGHVLISTLSEHFQLATEIRVSSLEHGNRMVDMTMREPSAAESVTPCAQNPPTPNAARMLSSSGKTSSNTGSSRANDAPQPRKSTPTPSA